MIRFILRSLVLLVISAFVGSVVVFALLRLAGGDIANVMLGPRATEESLAALRESFGLDRPLIEQYFSWIGGALTGDLGEAYSGRYNISQEILQRLEPTLFLTFGALFVAIPISLAIGVFSAMNHNKWRGAAVDAVAQVGIAIPQFFLALVLVLLFAVQLRWLPAGGYTSLFVDPIAAIRSMVLPIATLSLGVTAVFTSSVKQHHWDARTTALLFVRDDRLFFVDTLEILTAMPCSHMFWQTIDFDSVVAGGPVRSIRATIYEGSIASNAYYCDGDWPPENGSRDVSARYDWDSAANRFVRDSDVLARLQEDTFAKY